MKTCLLPCGVWLRGITALAMFVFGGCSIGGALAAGGSGAELSGPPVYSEKYAARMPRVCSTVTSPPSVSQATALVQCDAEGLIATTNSIALITDLTVQMGSPRDFMPGADNYLRDIDTSAKVYPLRGQSTGWSCGQATAANAGTNCMTWPGVPKGVGRCWYTLFKEWKCGMTTGGPTWKAHVKGPTTY